MIIAGAGGHGREVLYSFILRGFPLENISFFDEDDSLKKIKIAENSFYVITDIDELRQNLSVDPNFYLGVGNPVFRRKFDKLLTSNGGCMNAIMLSSNTHYLDLPQNRCDLMPYSFLGPDVSLGAGVLLNTGAQVHHDSTIGEYSEIGPKAMLLGGAKVGKMCRIGAGAVILPGVTLGDEVVVGAGAVVTRDHLNLQVLIGVPAKPKPKE